MPPRCNFGWIIFVALGCSGVLAAQSPPAAVPPAPVPPALKLPDGAVIVYAKSAEEALALSPGGVLLNAADYAALQKQIEEAKQQLAKQLPSLPSRCDIRVMIVESGERPSAQLSIRYTFRTTKPNEEVFLGGKRAFPIRANYEGNKQQQPQQQTPMLLARAEGYTVQVSTPGEQILTVDYETVVAPRGPKVEPGFEIGLPRAALTALRVTAPPTALRVSVGTPSEKAPTETAWLTEEPKFWNPPEEQLGKPLGPVDSLQVTWELPKSGKDPLKGPGQAPTTQQLSADVSIAVRVEESRVETTAKLQLRGRAETWQLILPAEADVFSERLDSTAVSPRELTIADLPESIGITRPVDKTKPLWTFRPPDTNSDWLLTVVVRTPRPRPEDDEQAHRGPFAVGPFLVDNVARQTGTLKVYAPPTVRVLLEKPTLDLRRTDTITTTDDEPSAVYRYTWINTPGGANKPSSYPPLAELFTRPLPGFVRVNPSYTLTRTESNWKLNLEAKITPVRNDIEQVLVDIPEGWQRIEATGAGESIDEIQLVEEQATSKRFAVRFVAPQRAPFDLKLSAVFPGPLNKRKDELLLPRFPNLQESQGKFIAIVPEGLEASGSVTDSEGNVLKLTAANLQEDRLKRPGGVRAISTTTDKTFTKADLSWQPFRPELLAEVRAEVVWQERQAVVSQTTRFKLAEGDPRPIPFEGAVLGLRVVSQTLSPVAPLPGSLEPVDREHWLLRLPPDAPREFTFTVVYAVPLPKREATDGTTNNDPNRMNFPLWLPETATKTEARVRLWNGGGTRRPIRWEGPWRELPPQVVPERDQIPWLTLSAVGDRLPLTWELQEIPNDQPAQLVERHFLQTWVANDGRQFLRARWLLRRWQPTITINVPQNVTTECWIEGKRADPLPSTEPTLLVESSDPTGRKRLKFNVPDIGTGRTLLALELRATTTDMLTLRRDWSLTPPRLEEATYRNPTVQQIYFPREFVTLPRISPALCEQRWTWAEGLFRPMTAITTAEAEAAFLNNLQEEINFDLASNLPTTDPLSTATLRTLKPDEEFRFLILPLPLWFLCCSVPIAFIGIMIGVWLKPSVQGVLLLLVGLLAILGTIWQPQWTSRLLFGMQPALPVIVVVVGVVAWVRRQRRLRMEYLPGFTRMLPQRDAGFIGVSTASYPPEPEESSRVTASNQVSLELPRMNSGSPSAAAKPMGTLGSSSSSATTGGS